MKIGILNLPIDNNYGGHLQRYALMSVLKSMGHDPININCRYGGTYTFRQRLRSKIVSIVRKVLDFLPNTKLTLNIRNRVDNANRKTDEFYEKYICHTNIILKKESLRECIDFDIYIVGSDQVWRKKYMHWGSKENCLETYFFDFLPENKKRIAYAVSLGVDEDDYSSEEIYRLMNLYNKFSAVSVREKSGIEILQNRGWVDPMPQWAIDPTLLIAKEEYFKIINENKTIDDDGKIITYILDPSPEKKNEIDKLINCEKVVNMGIRSRVTPSIPQWLRNIAHSKFVITDSYHGMIFSIIFNRPFRLFINKERGASRFDSVLQSLELSEDSLGIKQEDWKIVEKKIQNLRKMSIEILSKSLS